MNVGVYCSKIMEGAGGGHTFQAEILSALANLAQESRHTFFLMAHSSEGMDAYLQSGRIRLEVLPSPPTVSHSPAVKRWLQKLKGKLKPNIPGSHKRSIDLPDYTQAIEQSARSNGINLIWFVGPTFEAVPDVPFFATIWDLQHRLQPYFPEVSAEGVWDLRENFYSQYLRRAALVITGSMTGQAEIERFYQIPVERIKILAHPTPQFALEFSSDSDQEVLEKYDVHGEYLFYPAQFWAHKNHANLLHALRLLQDKFDFPILLVLVGSDQGNAAYIRDLVGRLDLSPQVQILGFVSQRELAALYHNALALVYLTLFGPDNLPPLEAFALGCPVIASDVSGAREQLGDAALFVDPAEPEQIAKAVILLHQDVDFRNMLVQRGYEHARRWTSTDFVRGLFGLLDDFERIRRNWA